MKTLLHKPLFELITAFGNNNMFVQANNNTKINWIFHFHFRISALDVK